MQRNSTHGDGSRRLEVDSFRNSDAEVLGNPVHFRVAGVVRAGRGDAFADGEFFGPRAHLQDFAR